MCWRGWIAISKKRLVLKREPFAVSSLGCPCSGGRCRSPLYPPLRPGISPDWSDASGLRLPTSTWVGMQREPSDSCQGSEVETVHGDDGSRQESSLRRLYGPPER